MLCGLIKSYQHFRGTICLSLKGNLTITVSHSRDSSLLIQFHGKNLCPDHGVAKIAVFCHLMRCTLLEGYSCYGGRYCSVFSVEMTP